MPHLEAHPLALLFPQIPDDELQALAEDIRQHGQREPVLTYEGKVLDGWNRVRACRLIGRKPRLMEFDPSSAKTTPEELVISANLRRRHLTTGQRAVVAVEWAEKAEREGFLTHVAKTTGEAGRPRSSALPEISVLLGTTEQRAREAKRIREANPALFAELKAGRVSLRSALAEIQPPSSAEAEVAEVLSTEANAPEPELVNLDQATKAEAEEAGGALARFPASPMAPGQPSLPAVKGAPAKEKTKEPAIKPPSAAVMKKAIERIECALGKTEKAEAQGGRLIPDKWDLVAFSKLSHEEMRSVARLLQGGWVYSEAVREVSGRLSESDEIRELHSRAVAAGGRLKTTVAGFLHLVVSQDQASTLEQRLQGWPAK